MHGKRKLGSKAYIRMHKLDVRTLTLFVLGAEFVYTKSCGTTPKTTRMQHLQTLTHAHQCLQPISLRTQYALETLGRAAETDTAVKQPFLAHTAVVRVEDNARYIYIYISASRLTLNTHGMCNAPMNKSYIKSCQQKQVN